MLEVNKLLFFIKVQRVDILAFTNYVCVCVWGGVCLLHWHIAF